MGVFRRRSARPNHLLDSEERSRARDLETPQGRANGTRASPLEAALGCDLAQTTGFACHEHIWDVCLVGLVYVDSRLSRAAARAWRTRLQQPGFHNVPDATEPVRNVSGLSAFRRLGGSRREKANRHQLSCVGSPFRA